MQVALELRMPSLDVSEELRTGDKVRFEGVGVVTGIADQMIDVTPVGGPRAEIPGERTVSVQIELAGLDVVGTSDPPA